MSYEEQRRIYSDRITAAAPLSREWFEAVDDRNTLEARQTENAHNAAYAKIDAILDADTRARTWNR